MQAVAFALPLLPGKTEADRSAMNSCWHGDRKADHQASRKRHGITREAAWIQQTPGGDVAVVFMEAKDLEAAFKGVAASDDPFDRWFRKHVRDVHGINLEEAMAPPEQVLDFHS
jgi:hypothetical protein